MNLEWTYSDKPYKWSNESFPTKEEAILYGSINTDHKLYVGQLVEYAELEYVVDCIEEVLI